MTVGFYYLTVLLAFAITLPLTASVGVTFAIADAIAFPCAVCLVFEALRSRAVRRDLHALYTTNRFIWWYFGWAAFAGVVGLHRSSDALLAFKDIVPAAVLYVLFGLTVTDRHRMYAVVTAAAIGVACHVALAIPQGWFGAPYVIDIHEGALQKVDAAGEIVTNRVVGLFVHPNGLGLFLLPVTILCVAAAFFGRGARRGWAFGALLPIAWALRMSEVKGAWVFAFIGLAMLVLPRMFERLRFPLALVAPIVTIVAIVWISVMRTLEGREGYGTVITRLELWGRAWDTLVHDGVTRLVGNGYPVFANVEGGTWEYPNAHNAWVNQILSFGVPALVFYLASVVSVLHRGCKTIVQSEGATRAWLVGGVTAISVVLGESFFEPCDRGVVFVGELFLLFAIVQRSSISSSASGCG